MKSTIPRFATTTVLASALMFAGATARAQTCNPGLGPAFVANQAVYVQIITALAPAIPALQLAVGGVVSQATYAPFLNVAHALANSITNGRLVITVPDGTVLIDTGKPDDPGRYDGFRQFLGALPVQDGEREPQQPDRDS